MAKKKVSKTAPIINQFAELAKTQRELADDIASKFLDFCNGYLDEKCVIISTEVTAMSNFSPAYLRIEAYTKTPTSDTSRLYACIGNVSFELSYNAIGEEYDDDHFKDELLKFLNK